MISLGWPTHLFFVCSQWGWYMVQGRRGKSGELSNMQSSSETHSSTKLPYSLQSSIHRVFKTSRTSMGTVVNKYITVNAKNTFTLHATSGRSTLRQRSTTTNTNGIFRHIDVFEDLQRKKMMTRMRQMRRWDKCQATYFAFYMNCTVSTSALRTNENFTGTSWVAWSDETKARSNWTTFGTISVFEESHFHNGRPRCSFDNRWNNECPE